MEGTGKKCRSRYCGARDLQKSVLQEEIKKDYKPIIIGILLFMSDTLTGN